MDEGAALAGVRVCFVVASGMAGFGDSVSLADVIAAHEHPAFAATRE